MSFNDQTLENLKRLCKIECSPEEDKSILERLNRVIEYMAQLKEVDTDQVQPCRYVLRSMLKNQMREDEVEDLLSREMFLSNASDQIGGMVRVPPVMKSS